MLGRPKTRCCGDAGLHRARWDLLCSALLCSPLEHVLFDTERSGRQARILLLRTAARLLEYYLCPIRHDFETAAP